MEHKETHILSSAEASIQSSEVDASDVQVNGVALDPTPFVSLSIEQWKTGDLILGGLLNITLNGKIYTSSGQGFAYISSEARSKLEGLGSIGECVPVVIQCDGTQLVNGYGFITALEISEGPDPTWTQIAEYSLSLQVHENHGEKAVKTNSAASSYVTDDEMISDFSESITMSVQEDALAVDEEPATSSTFGRAQVRYDFEISASGASVGCKDVISRKTGIDAAEEVIKRRVGSLEGGSISSSLGSATQVNTDLSLYHGGDKYLQVRDMSADPVAGSVSVSGSLIVRPNSITHSDAFVELTVESSKDVSRYGESVIITGNIEGFDSTSYSNFIQNFHFHAASKNKISAAEAALSSVISQLETIAQYYLGTGISGEDADCIDGSLLGICEFQLPASDFVCDVREINRSITRNFGQGSISFTSEFSDQKNCGIQGAAKTTTEVSHTYPTQLFAEFTIPFRGEPLLQNLGTTSKETVSAQVTINVDETGCNQVILTNLRGCARSKAIELASNEGAVPGSWYLTTDTVNYSNTGSFTVNLEYTKNYDCA